MLSAPAGSRSRISDASEPTPRDAGGPSSKPRSPRTARKPTASTMARATPMVGPIAPPVPAPPAHLTGQARYKLPPIDEGETPPHDQRVHVPLAIEEDPNWLSEFQVSSACRCHHLFLCCSLHALIYACLANSCFVWIATVLCSRRTPRGLSGQPPRRKGPSGQQEGLLRASGNPLPILRPLPT